MPRDARGGMAVANGHGMNEHNPRPRIPRPSPPRRAVRPPPPPPPRSPSSMDDLRAQLAPPSLAVLATSQCAAPMTLPPEAVAALGPIARSSLDPAAASLAPRAASSRIRRLALIGTLFFVLGVGGTLAVDHALAAPRPHGPGVVEGLPDHGEARTLPAPRRPGAPVVVEPAAEPEAPGVAKDAPARPKRTEAAAPATTAVHAWDELPPEVTVTAPFDRDAAARAVGAAARQATGCSNGTHRGRAAVTLTFAPSGRVTQALLDGGSPLAGTPVGSCVLATLRSAQVPAFAGAPVVVQKTVAVP
jgi:hypothetical protein